VTAIIAKHSSPPADSDQVVASEDIHNMGHGVFAAKIKQAEGNPAFTVDE
jgi:hypothetical protein